MAHAERVRTLDPDNLGELEDWLAGEIGADAVTLGPVKLLAGGAIGENWRIGARIEGGKRAGSHEWVLRTDAPSGVALSHQKNEEFACLLAAHQAGVCVPEPIAQCDDADLIGAPFMVTGFAQGLAQGRKIVRDPAIGEFGEALAERLGVELAKIHSVHPPRPELAFMGSPPESPALAQIEAMRRHLDDDISQAHPVLEYVLTWLETNAPPAGSIVLVHSDRTGNYMVDQGELTAILDWEFAHWGDRHEDIGWFCARCWRFGADEREAGGIGSRAAFYRGYDSVSDTPVDAGIVPYWEVLAAARWAVVALMQGERHLSGKEESIELILTGIMAPEMEYDALMDIAAIEAAKE